MPIRSQRRGERGQTILLVAVSIVSLLAIAALAIDVVSLYVARSEVQRAADAAALAGAQAIANSGITTLQPTDANLGQAQVLATSMATAAINAIVNASPSVNLVAGGPPTLVGSPVFNFLPNYNPNVTVTLQQTNLPTFFSRIWGSHLITTSASATAEVYNPANQPEFTPITPRCVKPWLVANQLPSSTANFVNPTNGAIVANAIGQSFSLRAGCGVPNTFPNCAAPFNYGFSGPTYTYYLPAQVTTNVADVCPSSTVPPCGVGARYPSYKSAIECCNVSMYSCGGNTFNNNYDQGVNPSYNGQTDAADGTECLIHASTTGPGAGQDTLQPLLFPYGPPVITAGSGPENGNAPQNGNPVFTSSSIATIPIIDITPGAYNTSFPYPVTVLGFLQAFINDVSAANPPDIDITVLNVVGCSQNETNGNPGNGNNPVVGGMGTSPIPVRLVTPPTP